MLRTASLLEILSKTIVSKTLVLIGLDGFIVLSGYSMELNIVALVEYDDQSAFIYGVRLKTGKFHIRVQKLY